MFKVDMTVHVHLASMDEVKALTQSLAILHNQGKIIMADLAAVKAALAKLAEDAVAEKGEVAAKIETLTTKIAELTAQIAAGTPVTEADLDELVAQINGIGTQVQDITVPGTNDAGDVVNVPNA